MKYLFYGLLLISIQATAQTRLIAHKSHGGTSLSYASFDASGNFGDPGPRLRIVEKVSDTVVVLTHEEWFDPQLTWTDTFYNHPMFSNPNMTVDSMKKTYYMNEVEFRNFDKKPVEEKKEPAASPEKTGTKRAETEPKKASEEEKQHNTIWLLLLIGTGTFLSAGLIPLVFRSRSLPVRRA